MGILLKNWQLAIGNWQLAMFVCDVGDNFLSQKRPEGPKEVLSVLFVLFCGHCLRVIYYWQRAEDEIWMLTLYAKSEEQSIPVHVLRAILREFKE